MNPYPIPWTWEKVEGGYGIYVKDANGKAIAQVWREAVAEQIVKGVNGATENAVRYVE